MSTPRTYARPLLTLPELERLQVDEARRDRGSNALVQGWQSTGAGIQAGDLAEQALAAEQTGDQEQARGLLRRMRVAQAQANVYAPDTRSVGDVKDLGTAVDWAGGALGSMARSATPAVGAGLAGAAAGALVAGPGGAVAGGVRGATASLLRTLPTALVSYDQLRGDQVAQQYGDPEVMQRTADERASQASKTAALQTVPEIFLPTRAVGAMVERQVAGQAGKRVANTAIDALAEGGTEVLQQELGFQGQQALGSTQERNVMDYVDAGLAGAVGGLGVSGTSNVLGAAADQSLGPDAPSEVADTGVPEESSPRTPRTLSERAQQLVSDLQTEPVERAAARFLTPDRVLADDLQGADPETMAAAIAEHDRTAPDIAEQTVASLLQQERISERDKAQLASMQGKMADPVNRTQLGILLGKNRLKEVGAATAEAMTGFLKRTKDAVSSRFSMEGMDTAPLVDALAPLYNEEAPAAAQSWIELAAKFEGVKSAAAIKDPELAQRLETMADALEAVQGQADIRKGLEAVGLTSMINLIDELQGVPGAKSDLRRPSSFLRTMLQKRDQRVSPSMTAKQIDLLAPKFASMSAKEQDTYAEAFAISFGSKEAARSVLDHYAKTFEGTRSTFKEQTDALPELDQLTRGFERPSQAAAEVAEGGLTEGDLSNLQATYRDANPARPFFASSEKEALEAAASKGGIVAGMDEYIRRTGRSAAEAFGRVKGDLERRLKASRNRDRGWLTSELERAVASGADLRTRQELEKRLVKATVREDLPKLEQQYAQMLSDAPAPEDMDPKRFDRALQHYRVVLRDGSDTRATDEDVHRFQRLLRVRQSIKPPAPPRDLSDTEARADYEERQAAYQAKVDAIDETVVTFTKTDGKTLKTSAESMAYASQVKGGDLQKFLSAVSSMLDRDDIASVDLPSTLVVLRQGEKRNRRTLAEMRGLSKVRKQLQARAENGSAKQKAFAKQALALIDETSGQSADRAQGKRGLAQTRDARAEAAAQKKAARAVANNKRDAEKRAAYTSARVDRKEGSLGEQALPLLAEVLPQLRGAEADLKAMREEGVRGPELDALREKVADMRSEERVLTELVREWLGKAYPMPSSQEYTSRLADDVQMEGGYDENDLRAAYLEEAIGVLEERLGAVREPLSKEEVKKLYALNAALKEASAKEVPAIYAKIDAITDRFNTKSSLVDGILEELNAKKTELNELLDSTGRNSRDGSLRVKDNPGRQISPVVQAEQEELAQSLMSAELNPDSIPLMEMSFQGKIDELRKRGGVDAAETLRAYQLAMGRLRRIKGKRKGDDAVSYTAGADGKPQALPLDPGTAYGRGEQSGSFDGPKVRSLEKTPRVARPDQVKTVVDTLVETMRGMLTGKFAAETTAAIERMEQLRDFDSKMQRRKAAALEKAANQKEQVDEKEQGQGQGRREEGRRTEVLKQNAQSVGTGPSVPTTVRELRDALLRMRGQNVRLAVNNLLSGYGKYERTVHGTLVERLITIAHAAPNKMSVLYHEALHDFFAELGKDPATLRIKRQLLDAASTGHVQGQLRELLKNEPAALAQLSDPEERLAYMFQFRMADPDKMRIGPNTSTLFGRIAAAVRKFVGMVTEMEKAEQILLALHDGRLADPSTAAQVMAQWSTFGDQFQHYAAPIKSAIEKVFSANTVQLRAMNIPALNKIADLFEDNVKKTGLLTARAQSGGIWRNRLEKLLTGHTDAEIRAAMTHMQSMKDPVTDLHKKLAKFFADIHEWQVQKGVMRFVGVHQPPDVFDGKNWIAQPKELVYKELPRVNNYFPRVWDIDMLSKHGDKFSRLLQKHLGYSQEQADDVLHQLRVGDGHLVKTESGARLRELLDTQLKLSPTDISDIMADLYAGKGAKATPKERAKYAKLLVDHAGMSQVEAETYLKRMRVGDVGGPKSQDRAGFSPYAQSVMGRELILDEAGAEALAEFQSKDFAGVMTRYIDQAVHRAEYTERFGNMGEGLDALMEQAKGEGATMHQIQRAKRLISGLDGTIHREMNPSIRQTQMALLTLQNLVLLPLAVFSQLIDPLGIAVRSGDVRDAGAAYKRVLTDIVQWASPRPDRAREMAEIIGAVQQDSVLQAMGVVHAGMYMSAGLRRVNDFMFRYNGMQGINNSFRTAAVTAAEKYILEHRNDARRMEELDLKPADIKEVKPGEIDYSTEKVQQALFRFADGAVVRPNAAHRPLWMSDPRFMLVAHLKQFAFSFQEVILKRVAHEKSYGNSGPLKILAMYAPIMIAADMAKWMLTGNLPQNWSVLHLFAHGVHRSGLLGVGTFGADAVSDVANDRSTILGFLGPTAQHLGLLASWIGGGVPVEDVVDRSVPLARLLTK